jgi:hypothetical protein
MKRLLPSTCILLILSAAGAARGEEDSAKAKGVVAETGKKAGESDGQTATASGALAEVKAATGIEDRKPTGEATTFKAGTLIYVWSQVTGAKGQEVEHVWKRDGKEFRRAKFSIGSVRWSMSSRIPGAAKGSYVVEVVLGEEKLGEVAFTVD